MRLRDKLRDNKRGDVNYCSIPLKPQEVRPQAVALEYKDSEDTAPKVIAKGSGWVADKIVELARKYNIPIYEDKELISILMKLDIGEIIPEKLYDAVAEIIAFVYTLDNKFASLKSKG